MNNWSCPYRITYQDSHTYSGYVSWSLFINLGKTFVSGTVGSDCVKEMNMEIIALQFQTKTIFLL